MIRIRRCLVLASSLLVPLAFAAAGPAAQAPSEPKFTPLASIFELMVTAVDPNADFIWESVSAVINREGETETRPRTDEEWVAVRNRALMLAEAGNLLKVRGRTVAPAKPIPGLAPEPPGPDDLPFPKIEGLVNANRAAFESFAQQLTDGALVALRAADARSVEGLYEAGDAIYQACENCHMVFWYPGAPSPGQ
jgi:hypothetical protein